MNSPARIVILDEEPQADWSDAMEFRLTYQGPLYATQREPRDGQLDSAARADNKHRIRQDFHRQLKRLWAVTPYLRTGMRSGPGALMWGGQGVAEAPKYDMATLSARHSQYGFKFVPLVSENLELMCSLDILFLRPDKPQLFWAGDIDNRLKTLFDAMKIPDAGEDYSTRRTPAAGEENFFILLEKDELITKVSVETDRLLDFSDEPTEANSKQVHLVITVRIRPYEMTLGNMQFG